MPSVYIIGLMAVGSLMIAISLIAYIGGKE